MTKGRPPEKILEMNKWLRAFCQRHSYTYVDYFAAMADAKGFLGADLADDGLHPNAKGYRVMAPLALAAIDNAVKAPAPTPSKRRK
jgi:lysophospholipase L1-like esterase